MSSKKKNEKTRPHVTYSNRFARKHENTKKNHLIKIKKALTLTLNLI